MKNLSKVLSFALIVCMLMTCMTAVAFAEIPDATYYNIGIDGDLKVGETKAVVVTATTVTGGVAQTVKSDRPLTVSSSDPSVVEVVSGKLVGKKEGVATITVYGFNPNWNGEKRYLMVVVSKGAIQTKNFDSETAGSYTETIGNYTNLPYSYSEYPRHGMTGLALSLDPLKSANSTSYGSLSNNSVNNITKDDVLSPITIEPGKITEFWMMSGTNVNPHNGGYFDFVLPDEAGFRVRSYNDNTTTVWKAIKGGYGTWTGVNSTGWGAGGFDQTGAGQWMQFVIDGSQVNPLTGLGIYTVYQNGRAVFTYDAPGKAKSGYISMIRSINPSDGKDSGNFYFDDIKMYELTKPVSNTLNVGEGGKVVVNGVEYTGNENALEASEGGVLEFTVIPEANKVIDTISYNGETLSKTTTSVVAVADAVLSVTFKDGFEKTVIPDGTYYDLAIDGELKIGETKDVVVTATTVTGGEAQVVKSDRPLTVSSSDTSVVDVVSGKLVGKKEGVATITVYGFNPSWNGENRYMMVVVSKGAIQTKNFNNETEKAYTETIGNYTNLPYSYLEYPRHGMTGLGLSLDPLKSANSAIYGSLASNSVTNITKDDVLSPITIEPGKITEFWMMSGTSVNPYNGGYFDLFLPDGAGFRVRSYNDNTTYVWKFMKGGHGTWTGFDSTGWGAAGFDGVAPGRWMQFVIDGSQVNPDTGVGTYTVYQNGRTMFTYAATNNNAKSGYISMIRSLNPSVEQNSANFFFDDIKVYEYSKPLNVTVNAGENGSVTMDGQTAPSTFTVEDGTTITLGVIPESNYQAKVTVNGADYTVTDYKITLTVTEDTVINVSFEKLPEVKPAIVSNPEYTWFKNENGVVTIFTYHSLNAFNTGETNLQYGVKLWNNANADEKVTLSARNTNGEPATAVPNAQFAIQAYGNAIKENQTYSVQPYIGETVGTTITPTYGN